MISGGNLTNSTCLCHFVLVCILFVFQMVLWSFQLSYFNKINPWFMRGGIYSKVNYIFNLIAWLLNLVALLLFIPNIILYFVSYYHHEKKGKNFSSFLRIMDTLAKVFFGFIIFSSVLSLVQSIMGIMPELGLNSDDSKIHYSKLYLSSKYTGKICGMGVFEVADKLGEKYLEESNYKEMADFHIWLVSVTSLFSYDFAPLCNSILIPMMVLSFLTIIFSSVVRGSYRGNMHGRVENQQNAVQQANNQNENQQNLSDSVKNQDENQQNKQYD